MSDAISGISEAGYAATPDQIKELGALSVGATRLHDTIGTTYLRALVRKAQGIPFTSALAIHAAHAELYPDVLRGVTTPDVATIKDPALTDRAENKRRALERNSRSNFARTAMSTLRKFVNAGGDLMGLDVPNVTKSFLVARTLPPIIDDVGVDIGSQTSPTHAVHGSLERAFLKFAAALDRDGDRTHSALHYIDRLNTRYL